MLGKIRRNLRRLASHTSGNATLLVAVGMPALIGGAGLAVDTAQWYMWKREMQYAADQAALAGAWSLVGGSTGDTYKTRAQQELSANLQVVNFSDTPTIQKANYAGGTNNSVVVSFSASKALPFSSMLMQHGITVAVSAQAVYEQGRSFTSCLIAVDPTTRGAITVGGNAYIVAGCGAAALSNNPDSVVLNGGATFQVGWIVSEGGIDQALADQGNDLYQYQSGLSDPYAKLTPPDNPTPRTYACSGGKNTNIAHLNEVDTVTQLTYTSSNGTTWKLSSSTVLSTGQTTTGTMEVSNSTKVGDTVVSNSSTQTGTVTTTTVKGKTTYTRIDTVTSKVGTVTSIDVVSIPAGANMLPGTYSDFTISCDTTMASGVYVIDGGMFSINSTDKLFADGVMIVLKNGAGIKINGGSNTYLRAMTYEQMIAAGLTETQATQLKDMLVFEDRNSPGNNQDFINGTADTVLDGTFYFPSSTVTFAGTAKVVSHCLVIAAKQIIIDGTANITNFCPAGVVNTVSVGGTSNSVRLVA